MTAASLPRRVDYYTADQMTRFSWWQRRRIRTRRAQAVEDAARHHYALYLTPHKKPGPKPKTGAHPQ